MKIKISGTLLAKCETEFWDAEVLARYGIAEAFCLYLIPHDGMNTVDTGAVALQNEFIFWRETTEEMVAEAVDDLQFEGTQERPTLFWSEVQNADPRFKTVYREKIEVEPGEELAPDYLMNALYEAEANGNLGEPDILDFDTWAEWKREQTEKTRARNLPPIANFGANGLDNLPLFVAAGNALLARHEAMAERIRARYGDCTAYRWQKRKLYQAGLSWAL